MRGSQVLAPVQAGLTAKLRDRISAGSPVREIAFQDMPLWLFRGLDFSREVEAVFVSETGGVITYTDGTWTLRRAPKAA